MSQLGIGPNIQNKQNSLTQEITTSFIAFCTNIKQLYDAHNDQFILKDPKKFLSTLKEVIVFWGANAQTQNVFISEFKNKQVYDSLIFVNINQSQMCSLFFQICQKEPRNSNQVDNMLKLTKMIIQKYTNYCQKITYITMSNCKMIFNLILSGVQYVKSFQMKSQQILNVQKKQIMTNQMNSLIPLQNSILQQYNLNLKVPAQIQRQIVNLQVIYQKKCMILRNGSKILYNICKQILAQQPSYQKQRLQGMSTAVAIKRVSQGRMMALVLLNKSLVLQSNKGIPIFQQKFKKTFSLDNLFILNQNVFNIVNVNQWGIGNKKFAWIQQDQVKQIYQQLQNLLQSHLSKSTTAFQASFKKFQTQNNLKVNFQFSKLTMFLRQRFKQSRQSVSQVIKKVNLMIYQNQNITKALKKNQRISSEILKLERQKGQNEQLANIKIQNNLQSIKDQLQKVMKKNQIIHYDQKQINAGIKSMNQLMNTHQNNQNMYLQQMKRGLNLSDSQILKICYSNQQQLNQIAKNINIINQNVQAAKQISNDGKQLINIMTTKMVQQFNNNKQKVKQINEIQKAVLEQTKMVRRDIGNIQKNIDIYEKRVSQSTKALSQMIAVFQNEARKSSQVDRAFINAKIDLVRQEQQNLNTNLIQMNDKYQQYLYNLPSILEQKVNLLKVNSLSKQQFYQQFAKIQKLQNLVKIGRLQICQALSLSFQDLKQLQNVNANVMSNLIKQNQSFIKKHIQKRFNQLKTCQDDSKYLIQQQMKGIGMILSAIDILSSNDKGYCNEIVNKLCQVDQNIAIIHNLLQQVPKTGLTQSILKNTQMLCSNINMLTNNYQSSNTNLNQLKNKFDNVQIDIKNSIVDAVNTLNEQTKKTTKESLNSFKNSLNNMFSVNQNKIMARLKENQQNITNQNNQTQNMIVNQSIQNNNNFQNLENKIDEMKQENSQNIQKVFDDINQALNNYSQLTNNSIIQNSRQNQRNFNNLESGMNQNFNYLQNGMNNMNQSFQNGMTNVNQNFNNLQNGINNNLMQNNQNFSNLQNGINNNSVQNNQNFNSLQNVINSNAMQNNQNFNMVSNNINNVNSNFNNLNNNINHLSERQVDNAMNNYRALNDMGNDIKRAANLNNEMTTNYLVNANSLQQNSLNQVTSMIRQGQQQRNRQQRRLLDNQERNFQKLQEQNRQLNKTLKQQYQKKIQSLQEQLKQYQIKNGQVQILTQKLNQKKQQQQLKSKNIVQRQRMLVQQILKFINVYFQKSFAVKQDGSIPGFSEFVGENYADIKDLSAKSKDFEYKLKMLFNINEITYGEYNWQKTLTNLLLGLKQTKIEKQHLIQTLQTKINNLQSETSQLKRKILQVQHKTSISMDQNDRIQNQNMKTSNDLMMARGKIAQLTNSLALKSSKVGQLNQIIDDLNTKVRNLSDKEFSKSGQLRNSQTRLNAQIQKANKLRKQLQKLKFENVSLKSQKQTQKQGKMSSQSMNNALNFEIQKKTSVIKDLNNKIRQLQISNKGLQNKLQIQDKSSKNVSQANKLIIIKNQELKKELQLEKQKFLKQFQIKNQKIKQLQKNNEKINLEILKLNSFPEKYQKAKQSIENINKNVYKLNNDLQKTQNQLSQKKEQITKLQKRIHELNLKDSEMKKVKQNMYALQSQVKTLKEQKQLMQSDIARYKRLQSEISNLKQQSQQNKIKISQQKGLNDNLQKRNLELLQMQQKFLSLNIQNKSATERVRDLQNTALKYSKLLLAEQNQTNQIKKLNDQLTILQAKAEDINNLKMQLQKMRILSSQQSNLLKQKKEQFNKLKSSLELLQAQYHRLERQQIQDKKDLLDLNNLRQQAKYKKQQIQRLKKDIQSTNTRSRMQRQQQSERYIKLTTQNSQLLNKISKNQQLIQSKKTQIQHINAKIQKLIEESIESDSKIVKSKQKMQKITSRINKIKQLNAPILTTIQKIINLGNQNEVIQVKNQILQFQTQLKTEQINKIKKMFSQKFLQFQRLTQMEAKLRQKISSFANQKDRTQLKNLKKVKIDVQQATNSLLKHIKKLQIQIQQKQQNIIQNDTKNSRTLSQLKIQMEGLNRKKQNHEQYIQQLKNKQQQERQKTKLLQNQIQQFKQQIQQKNSKIQELKRLQQDQKSKVILQKEQIESFTKKIQQISANQIQIEQQKILYRQKLKQLEDAQKQIQKQKQIIEKHKQQKRKIQTEMQFHKENHFKKINELQQWKKQKQLSKMVMVEKQRYIQFQLMQKRYFKLKQITQHYDQIGDMVQGYLKEASQRYNLFIQKHKNGQITAQQQQLASIYLQQVLSAQRVIGQLNVRVNMQGKRAIQNQKTQASFNVSKLQNRNKNSNNNNNNNNNNSKLQILKFNQNKNPNTNLFGNLTNQFNNQNQNNDFLLNISGINQPNSNQNQNNSASGLLQLFDNDQSFSQKQNYQNVYKAKFIGSLDIDNRKLIPFLQKTVIFLLKIILRLFGESRSLIQFLHGQSIRWSTQRTNSSKLSPKQKKLCVSIGNAFHSVQVIAKQCLQTLKQQISSDVLTNLLGQGQLIKQPLREAIQQIKQHIQHYD